MAAFGDCFKTLEETLSKRVEEVVKEYHQASQEEARDELDRKMHALFDTELPKKVHDILETELDKRVHSCLEAARDHLMQSVAKAVEEKIKGLSTRHATAQLEMEAKAKEMEACRVEIDEIREDLISRQQAFAAEGRALLEDYRNRAVECMKGRAGSLPSEDYSAPAISTAPSTSTVEKAELTLTFGPDEEQDKPETSMMEGPLLPSTEMANLSWDRPAANASKSRGGRGRRVYWALVVVSLSLLAILAMAVCTYPFLTLGILCMMCLWLLYLCGEEPLIQIVTAWATHGGSCQKKLQMLASALRAVQGLRSSHEKEHRIKALLYSLGVCVLIFNPEFGLLLALFDSSSPIIGLGILAAAPVTTTWIAHRIVQIMHARSLRRHGVEQPENAPVGSEAVQEAMRVIAEKLQERGRRRAQSERKILEILSDKHAPAMLNELVERMAQSSECSLRRLLEHFREPNPHGVPRSELIELLCKHRANNLSVRAKSALLHTLMVMRLSSCSNAEACVESLLLSVGGDDLSDLKSMQDGIGDIHSMHKLIFQDLTDLKLRREVLNHFLAEGTAQVAHRALMASNHFRVLLEKAGMQGCTPKHLSFFQEAMQGQSPGRPRSLPSYRGECGHSWLKIITDMDDTLQCSAARWPAGIDARYPRHACYPGVTAFYRELQGGGDVGQLVALSARPHIVGDYMENRIFARFKEMTEKNGLHTMPALLPGSVDAGGKFLLSGGNDDGMRALAEKKLESFEQYLALYPEFRIVFIGDNGQADYDVGQRICQKYPHNVEQVWIHEVQEQSKTWRHDPASDAPVAFFEDYIMAAVSAATRPQPLVTPEGLRRIVTAAREDFKNVKNWPSEGHREAEAERLNQSILRARDVLSALGLDEEVELILDLEKQKAGPSDEEGGNQSVGKESDPETARPDPERRSIIGIARGLAKGTMAARVLARRPLPAPAPAKVEEPAFAEESTQTTSPEAPAEAVEAAGPAPAQQTGMVTDSPSLVANETPPAAAAASQQLRPGIFGGLVSGLVSGSSQMAPAPRSSEPSKDNALEPLGSVDFMPPPVELPPSGEKAAANTASRDVRDQSPPLPSTSLEGSSSTGRSLLGFASGWTKLSSTKASNGEEEVVVVDGPQQPAVAEDARPEPVETSAGSGARSLFGITFGLGSAPQPALSPEGALSSSEAQASSAEPPVSSDTSGALAGTTLQQRAELAERQLAELQESRHSLEQSKVTLEQLLAGRDVELLELRARLAALEECRGTPPGPGGQAPGGVAEAEPQESVTDREARPVTGADVAPVSQRTSLFQGVARAFTGSAARGSPARRSARGSPTSSPVCASPDRTPVDLQSHVGTDAQDPALQSSQSAAEPATGGSQEQQLGTVAEELGEAESGSTNAPRAFFGGLTRGLAKHGSTPALPAAEAREEVKPGESVAASPPLSRGQSPASSGAMASSPERATVPVPALSARHARSLSARGPPLPAVVEGQPARGCENSPAAAEGEAGLVLATPPKPPEGKESDGARTSDPQDVPEAAGAGACGAATGQEDAEFDEQPSMRKVGTFPCFHSAHSLAPEADHAGDTSTPGTASTPRD